MTKPIRIKDGFPNQRMVLVPQDVIRQCRKMPIVQDLHLCGIGSFPETYHHYVHRKEGIAEAILIHCTSGRGWCRLHNRRVNIDEGKILIIPPNEPHTYGADEEIPWAINWFHIGGKRTDAWLQMLDVNAGQPLLNLPDEGLLARKFEEIYSLLELGYTDSSLLGLSTGLSHYLGLIKLHQRAFYNKGRQAEDKIDESMTFMRANIGRSLKLEELAAQAGMSVPHYCSLFKRQTNSSPILYMIRLKMQHACELLTTSRQTVLAIGQSVGYDDQFYFCRIFKKTVGLSPTEYRKSLKA